MAEYIWTWLEMARTDWEHLEIAGMNGNDWKSLEITRTGWKWKEQVEIAGN